MTNKELQKLGRRELLQLLLEQAKEAERLGKMLKENDQQLKQLEESYERLRDRLDKKDAQIHELKDALEAERGKREAELAQVLRSGGPIRQAGQYPPMGQGYAPPSGGAAPAAEATGVQPGFPNPEPYPYQPPPAPPYSAPEASAPDPFPYQVPPQPGAAACQTPADPFPYQPPYLGAPAPDPYPSGMEAQYQYPPPRPERKRQGGQHGKMPFRLKRDQENGKTTLFFGWQHD